MKRKFILAITIGLLLFSVVSAQKKPATKLSNTTKIFGVNLIKNGNAESGNGNGWTNADELKTIIYGEFGGGPTKDSAGPSNRGEKYFYVRTTTDQPTASFTQKLNLVEIGEKIDKGNVFYNFGGWFGVANGSSSAGSLKVSFVDATGKELKKDETAEITEANRPPDEVLIQKNKGGNLPVGTRKIEVTLFFKIFGGHEEIQDNLAFADNLSLDIFLSK